MANLRVTWNVNTEQDMNRYRVYRSDSCSGAFSLLATVSHPQSSYLDTDPLLPTSAYKVTAIDNVNNESPLSSCVSYTQSVEPEEPEPVPTGVYVRQCAYGGLNNHSYTPSAFLDASTALVFLFWRGDVTCTMSDSRGQTYSDCGSGRVARPTDGYVQAFYSPNVTVGSTTLTATFSGAGATFMYMVAMEIGGASATFPIDDFAHGIASSGLSVSTNAFSPTSTVGAIVAFADCSTTTLRDQIAGVNATTLLTIDEITAVVEGISFTSNPGSNITARANTTSAMTAGAILAVAFQSESVAPTPPVLHSLTPATASIDIGEGQSFVITLTKPPTEVETTLIELIWSTFDDAASSPASATFSATSQVAAFTVTGLVETTVTVKVTYRGVTKTSLLTIEAPEVAVPSSPLPVAKQARVASNMLSLWTDYLL